MHLLFCLSILLTGALAQVSIYGPCPNVTPMTNFDPNKFTGFWYEIERYDNIHEDGFKCTYTNYSIVDNNRFKIDLWAVLASSGAMVQWEGNATPINNKSFAQLNLEYPEYSEFRGAELLILHTDYESYAIEWMCQYLEEISQIYVWIFARSNVLDMEIRQRARQLLSQHNIPCSPLSNVQHDNCPPL